MRKIWNILPYLAMHPQEEASLNLANFLPWMKFGYIPSSVVGESQREEWETRHRKSIM
jgi:hypothetical protein